jgi:hypothetical protein
MGGNNRSGYHANWAVHCRHTHGHDGSGFSPAVPSVPLNADILAALEAVSEVFREPKHECTRSLVTAAPGRGATFSHHA